MRQGDIVANPDPRSRAHFPYFIVLQSHLVPELSTVLVAPLFLDSARRDLPKLYPRLAFDGRHYMVSVPELAGIDRKRLGKAVGHATEVHPAIIRAIDALLSGV